MKATIRSPSLIRLLAKSLLRQSEQKGGKPRLFLLETIREFGLDRLSESGEATAAQQTHASYYLAWAEASEPALFGGEQVSWFDSLESEHENLRAALRWLIMSRDIERALRLTGALVRFWGVHGHVGEGRQWLSSALQLPGSCATTVRAKALNGAGWLATLQGDNVQAEAMCQESLALYQEIGERAGTALALHRLGSIKAFRGQYTEAHELHTESVACYRQIDDKRGLAYSLMALAGVGMSLCEESQVHAWLEESLALFRMVNNIEGIAWSLFLLARLLYVTDDLGRAYACSEECLTLFHALQLDEGRALTLHLLGTILLLQGEAARARVLLEKSLELFQAAGTRHFLVDPLLSLTGVALVQGNKTAARSYWEESLALLKQLHHPGTVVAALEALAAVAARQGEALWAARLWGTASSLREAQGLVMAPLERPHYERLIATTRAQPGEQGFAAAWAEGRTLTPEQVFTARAQATRSLSQEQPVELTTREVVVLRLLARGFTNAQIAEQLVISPRTVNAHLRSIYSKVGLTSRTAATRYAIDHGLI